MNSFQSIAISRNTSLAIVAPGIAEALFATALGYWLQSRQLLLTINLTMTLKNIHKN